MNWIRWLAKWVPLVVDLKISRSSMLFNKKVRLPGKSYIFLHNTNGKYQQVWDYKKCEIGWFF